MEIPKMTLSKFLLLFKQFSRSEQLIIAKKINELTFEEQWTTIDKELPDAEMSEEEIMYEVKAVRYGE